MCKFLLEDLELGDPNFYELEEEALEALPRNAEGLERLIDYLDVIDESVQAWQFLFDAYGEMLKQCGRYEELKKRAIDCFPEDISF